MTDIKVMSLMDLENSRQKIIDSLRKEAIREVIEIMADEKAINEYYSGKIEKINKNGRQSTRGQEIISRTLKRIKKELLIETDQELFTEIIIHVESQAEIEITEELKVSNFVQTLLLKKKSNIPNIELEENIKYEFKNEVERRVAKKIELAHTTFPRWVRGESPVSIQEYLDVIISLCIDKENDELSIQREKSIFNEEFVKYYIEDYVEDKYQEMFNVDYCNEDVIYSENTMNYIRKIENKFLEEEKDVQKKIAKEIISYFYRYV